MRRLTRHATVNREFLEIEWGAACRRPLLLWIYIQHTLTFAYFALLGAMHLSLDVGMRIAMHSYAPGPSGVLLIATGVLHLSPFVPARLWPRRCRCNSRRYWPRLPINVEIAANHFVAISCETYTAYDMSCTIVTAELAGLYAALLALNCLCTTWLLFLRHAASKIVWVSIVDSAISFLLSAGFPLFFLLVPLLHFMFTSSKDISHSLRWFAEIYSTSRALSVSSLGGLFLRMLPGVTNYVVLRRVTVSLGRQRRRGPVTPEVGKKAFTTQQRYGRVLKGVLIINVLWGLAVVAASTRATYHRATCPAYCVYASAPWFNTNCNCIYALVNCANLGIVGTTIDSYFDASVLGPNLVFLHVERCDVSSGLAATTITAFQLLYALQLESTNLTHWDVEGSELQSSIKVISIRGSRLEQVPRILAPAPPGVRWIFIVDSLLTYIPTSAWESWTSLLSLWLGDNGLTNIPAIVWENMTSLQILALNNNALSTIPEAELSRLPQLHTLHLHNNQLVTFPATLLAAHPTLQITLNHNPIASIESLYPNAQVASTLWCKSQPVSDVCYADCAETCGRPVVGNYLCDLSCNTTTCQYDEGDCIY
ncbi:hypothetical protein ACHHYP_01585 [Achlya hypogyna]|uniref:LNR domain-containing protein n=1 Tax=Achlya hypogyna TaxID=1202772 RepID=A0A1V9Z8C5_ACHHY|nr:hypothetical protein ACHHYP_01585 [Achlya hypogyna]